MELLKRLKKAGLITPPKFLVSNTAYMTIMGSAVYGVSNVGSDVDIYGFCIPNKEIVFPHLAGEIQDFGKKAGRFEQWQQHHVKDPSGKEYDFSVFNIVKYFQLCMDNNPNMIDSLFVPRCCIIHSTQVGELVRGNRKLFLHRGAYHKFKGYAYSQLHKMHIKNPQGLADLLEFEAYFNIPGNTDIHDVEFELCNRHESFLSYLTDEQLSTYNKLFMAAGKRALDTKILGYDTKFAYHIVRLLDECVQILAEGDIDLQRNREQLKSVRRGEWTLQQVENYFQDKEKQLEDLYVKSTLPYKPNEAKLKELLLNCLEIHYGSLDKAIHIEPDLEKDLKRIAEITSKYI